MNTIGEFSYKTGVVVGRFQVPELHEGHKHLINTALNYPDIEHVLVVIGCVSAQDERNPYSPGYVWESIEREYGQQVSIAVLYDHPNDNKVWSEELDRIIAIDFAESPVFFGSRDSFYRHYTGDIPYIPVTEIRGVSGTQIREELAAKQAKNDILQETFEVSAIVNPRHHYDVFMQLSEEVGELATELAIQTGAKNRAPGPDGIIGESLDIIACALDIIWKTDPNITMSELMVMYRKKLNKWKILATPTDFTATV